MQYRGKHNRTEYMKAAKNKADAFDKIKALGYRMICDKHEMRIKEQTMLPVLLEKRATK